MQQQEELAAQQQPSVSVHSHPDLPKLKSTEDICEAEYLFGVHVEGDKRTRCVIPPRFKDLNVNMEAMLQATRTVFEDVKSYDCDLFGYVEPKAPVFLTPWQGLPLQQHALEELSTKLDKHLFGIVPQFNDLQRIRTGTTQPQKIAFTGIIESLLGLMEKDADRTITLIVPSNSHLVRPQTYLRTEQRRWKDKVLPFVQGIAVLTGNMYTTEWRMQIQHCTGKRRESATRL
eukprot:gene5351-2168_t